MFRFALRRIGMVVPTFIGITVLAFALIHLIPGDPIEVMMGERGVDPAMHAAALHRLGLDEPLPMQYLHYVWRAVHGNLGTSFITDTSVMGEFLGALSGHRRAVVLCAAVRPRCRPAGRRLRRAQAQHARRSWRDGHSAHGLFDADLLVGSCSSSWSFR